MATKTIRSDVAAGIIAGVIGLFWIGAIVTSLVFPPPVQIATGAILTGDQIALREHEWGFNQFTKGGPEICIVTGHTLNITLTNDGHNLHGFQIVRDGGTPVPGLSGLNATERLSPLEVKKLTLKIDQPGNYYYICPVTGHRAKGMIGACVVQASCAAS
jgi:hypothetical protein